MDHKDRDLRADLAALDLPARDALRRVLILDQADRDAIAAELLRYRGTNGSSFEVALGSASSAPPSA